MSAETNDSSLKPSVPFAMESDEGWGNGTGTYFEADCVPLGELLARSGLLRPRTIDFLNVDVEGGEIEVFQKLSVRPGILGFVTGGPKKARRSFRSVDR